MPAPQDWSFNTSLVTAWYWLNPVSYVGGRWFITDVDYTPPAPGYSNRYVLDIYTATISTTPTGTWEKVLPYTRLPADNTNSFNTRVLFDGTNYATVWGMWRDGDSYFGAHILYTTTPTQDNWSRTLIVDGVYDDITYNPTDLATDGTTWTVCGYRTEWNGVTNTYDPFIAYATNLSGPWTVVNDPLGVGNAQGHRIGYAGGHWVYLITDIDADNIVRVFTATSPGGAWTESGSFPAAKANNLDRFGWLKYENGYHVIVGGQLDVAGNTVNRIYYASDPTGAWSEVTEATFGFAYIDGYVLRDITYAAGAWIINQEDGGSGYLAYYLTNGSPNGTFTAVTPPDATARYGGGIDHSSTHVVAVEMWGGVAWSITSTNSIFGPRSLHADDTPIGAVGEGLFVTSFYQTVDTVWYATVALWQMSNTAADPTWVDEVAIAVDSYYGISNFAYNDSGTIVAITDKNGLGGGYNLVIITYDGMFNVSVIDFTDRMNTDWPTAIGQIIVCQDGTQFLINWGGGDNLTRGYDMSGNLLWTYTPPENDANNSDADTPIAFPVADKFVTKQWSPNDQVFSFEETYATAGFDQYLAVVHGPSNIQYRNQVPHIYYRVLTIPTGPDAGQTYYNVYYPMLFIDKGWYVGCGPAGFMIIYSVPGPPVDLNTYAGEPSTLYFKHVTLSGNTLVAGPAQSVITTSWEFDNTSFVPAAWDGQIVANPDVYNLSGPVSVNLYYVNNLGEWAPSPDTYQAPDGAYWVIAAGKNHTVNFTDYNYPNNVWDFWYEHSPLSPGYLPDPATPVWHKYWASDDA